MGLLSRAQSILKLDPYAAQVLFAPCNHSASVAAEPGEYNFVSPQKAAAVLRSLAETGEVNWTIDESERPWYERKKN